MKSKIFTIAFFLLTVLLVSETYSQTRSITFQVTLETDTPQNETVCVYLPECEGMNEEFVFPLSNTTENSWSTTLEFTNGWLTPGVTYHYKYCRNYIYNGADEIVNGNNEALRQFTMQTNNDTISDTITQWKWWPSDGRVPDINKSGYLQISPANLPDSTFQCGVELFDYWDHTFIHSVAPTLDRIATVCKAKYVEYNPVPEIVRFYPTPIINREGNNGTPEADLIQIITEAKRHGLKVYLDPFPWALNVSDTSAYYHSDNWWRAYEEQWRPIILYYAQISEEYDVDVLTFNMWPNRWSVSQDEAPVVDSLSNHLLNDVKEIYHGKIAVEFSPWGPDLSIYGQGDFLKFNIADFWPYQLSTSMNPTVSEMLANLNSALDRLYEQSTQKWGKPVLLSQIAASSYDGSVIGQPNWESQLYYYPDDPNVPVDLQEQADVYEAFMQAFTARDWIAGVYSFSYNYWNSLDKSPSIRSKPAEEIVAKWYNWIEPNMSTALEDNSNLITGYQLFQNYPNPFNPVTTISFSVPSRGFVSLKIFDLLGREVATIVSDEYEPGKYSVQWNAEQYSSGIYFMKLHAGNFRDIKKLILLK